MIDLEFISNKHYYSWSFNMASSACGSSRPESFVPTTQPYLSSSISSTDLSASQVGQSALLTSRFYPRSNSAPSEELVHLDNAPEAAFPNSSRISFSVTRKAPLSQVNGSLVPQAEPSQVRSAFSPFSPSFVPRKAEPLSNANHPKGKKSSFSGNEILLQSLEKSLNEMDDPESRAEKLGSIVPRYLSTNEVDVFIALLERHLNQYVPLHRALSHVTASLKASSCSIHFQAILKKAILIFERKFAIYNPAISDEQRIIQIADKLIDLKFYKYAYDFLSLYKSAFPISTSSCALKLIENIPSSMCYPELLVNIFLLGLDKE